ncbi:IMS domain-containing protein [Synechocystis sp. LKSZ1]|uniref:IMS domain-containing protein n=1 Tax=Synechocystis sp. LKSZ1 TaxID=3144951 RepID=UPI00336BEBB1
MRIPLDYYRVLGIPLHSLEEQIEQAYQDRLVQLPRREYSEAAITSRNELYAEAYAVLSNPDQRRYYDQQWWGQNEEAVSLTWDALVDESREADPELPAADEDDLSPAPFLDLAPEQWMGAFLVLQDLGEYELVLAFAEPLLLEASPGEKSLDLVLTVALAYLELSREQWQQQTYEAAATSGLKALARLQEHNDFLSVQAEIRQELYKLRPYRILELLTPAAMTASDLELRQRGLALLQDMIQDRGGIDGKGDDQSGLTTDDFLKFIQQLRSTLTLPEQQQLFSPESARASVISRYLRFQILIAQGLSQKEPQRLLEAQTLLQNITNHQDVALEEAICALLLGQTETAMLALEKSQDQKALALIRDPSSEDSDAFLGLYRYTEKWLTTELCPYFRDITTANLSLTDYFADADVQYFIEHDANSLTTPSAVSSSLDTNPLPTMATPFATYSDDISELPTKRRKGNSARSRTAPAPVSPSGSTQVLSSPAIVPAEESAPTPISSSEEAVETTPRRKRRRKVTIKPLRFGLFLTVVAAVIGLGSVFWAQSRSPLNGLEGEQLDVSLLAPPIELPDPNKAQVLLLPQGDLNADVARQVVETWLARKAQAFGQSQNSAALTDILVEPILSQQQNRVRQDQLQKQYREYQHQADILSFQVDARNPQQAEVIARVKEATKYYKVGRANQPLRQEKDDLTVRYQLQRQGDQWKITDISVQKIH